MTSHDPIITAVAADDPRILPLVRDLDADLAARYPDEPCTGGAHIHPGVCFLLAEVDGRPVGCCAVQPFPFPDTAAELKRMYVAPQARGRGIGARLLAEAERLATVLGHGEIRLETAVHQPEAIALYTRAGYTPIPNYPPYQHKTLSRCYAKPLQLPEARPEDRELLMAFLAGQGLSPQDVLAPGTRYWLTRDAAGPAVTVGLEGQGPCVLLRSVAVRRDLRAAGSAGGWSRARSRKPPRGADVRRICSPRAPGPGGSGSASAPCPSPRPPRPCPRHRRCASIGRPELWPRKPHGAETWPTRGRAICNPQVRTTPQSAPLTSLRPTSTLRPPADET
ncbi:GNAT family N-acetyltransferase [Streptomyces mirabilis]|nr:GNAT family N-acetyltransferase [Streptomyces mirabilis]